MKKNWTLENLWWELGLKLRVLISFLYLYNIVPMLPKVRALISTLYLKQLLNWNNSDSTLKNLSWIDPDCTTQMCFTLLCVTK